MNLLVNGYTIFAIAILLLALAIVWMGVKVAPQGRNWTVERFGRYTRTLKPGLNLIMPFVDQIGHRMSVMERTRPSPKAAYEVANLESILLTSSPA